MPEQSNVHAGCLLDSLFKRIQIRFVLASNVKNKSEAHNLQILYPQVRPKNFRRD